MDCSFCENFFMFFLVFLNRLTFKQSIKSFEHFNYLID